MKTATLFSLAIAMLLTGVVAGSLGVAPGIAIPLCCGGLVLCMIVIVAEK